MAKHVDKKRELGSKVVRWCEEVLGLPDYALLQPILRQARAATIAGEGESTAAKPRHFWCFEVRTLAQRNSQRSVSQGEP